MSKELDRVISVAKAAISAIDSATSEARKIAGAKVREAFKLGDAENISRREVCKRIGLGKSWLYELAGVKEDSETQRLKKTARNRKYKADKKLSVSETDTPEDPEHIEEFNRRKAEENPENYTTAFAIRVDQAIEFCREASKLTKGMLKHSKNPAATRKEIAEHGRAVVAAWSHLVTQIEEVPNGEMANKQRA